jgi:hypothetical protein
MVGKRTIQGRRQWTWHDAGVHADGMTTSAPTARRTAFWARLVAAVGAILLLPSLVHDALGMVRFHGAWFYLDYGHPDIAVGAVVGSVMVLTAFVLAVVACIVRGPVTRFVLLVVALGSCGVSLVADLISDLRLADSLGVAFDAPDRLRSWLGLEPLSYYVDGGYFRPTLQWVASIGFTLATLTLTGALVLSAVAATRRGAATVQAHN